MTEQTPSSTPPSKGRRWMKVALFASLAVNVAVIGIVVGTVARVGSDDNRRPPRMDEVSGPYTRALTGEDRRRISQRLKKEQGELVPNRAQLRSEFTAMVAALRSTPFEPEAVSVVLERQRQIGAKRGELGHQLLLEHLTEMSDDERAAFATRLEEGLKRHRAGGREGGKPLRAKPQN
ncbi:MAG: periplasmic heavy metal sensor [Thalassovita sp.]